MWNEGNDVASLNEYEEVGELEKPLRTSECWWTIMHHVWMLLANQIPDEARAPGVLLSH